MLLIRGLSTGPRAVWLDPILILFVALAVRWLFVINYPSTGVRRFSDSWEYFQRAQLLLMGADLLTDTSWHQWQAWLRPPGYFAFLAGVFKWSQQGLDALVRVQAVLSALTAAISYYIAYPLFGRSAAIATGLLIAFSTQSVISASWVLSEVLFTSILVVALAFLAWSSVRPDWRLAAAAGLFMGCAALVRPTPITFVPLAALCLISTRGRKWLVPAAAMVAAMLAVTVPWSVRNGLVLDRAPVFENTRVANFLFAHPDDEIIRHRDLDLTNPGDRKTYYFDRIMKNRRSNENTVSDFTVFARGLVRMAGDPIGTSTGFARSLRIFFSGFPSDFARTSLGEMNGCRVAGWTDSLNVTWWLTFGLAVCGILWAAPNRHAWSILLWFFYLTIITNLFFFHGGDPGRFRFSLLPVIAVFGGHFVARIFGTTREFLKKNLRSRS
jgi:4-amino-4-deoxy-L-arabinose transferase-like glycosyltransferase